MRSLRLAVTLLALVLSPNSLFAYKEPVHRLITRHAFDRLAIDFRTRLGVAKDHEINDIPLRDLIQEGADDEDDFINSLNHFLDPEHDVPLTTRLPLGICIWNGSRADRWAKDPGNVHSLYWAPLTYRHAILGPNPGTRDTFLRELFLTFGHVAHLVQDMAQPEHTRNDQHLYRSTFFLSNGTFPSVWEEWGLENLVETRDPVTGAAIPPAVSYEGYPTVVLPDYGSYFQTPGLPTLERKGMANFSNRSFVTQDTNYSDQTGGTPCDFTLPRCHEYIYPSIHDPLTTLRIESVDEAVLDDFGNLIVKQVDEAIYTSRPYDAYTQTLETDPFHTFHSLLDMETRKHGCPVYSLGDGSYLSRASLLMPRAVGYSAGLIQHFFRGRIDVTWKSTGSGQYDMTITNRSGEAIGADARVGAVFRTDPSYFGPGSSDDTGPIIDATLADVVPGFAGLAAGESVVVHHVQPFGLHPGDALTKFERRVVITGTLGFEPNEAIGVIQPPITGPVLRAEITWPEPIPPRAVHVTDGIGYASWFPLGGGYQFCNPSTFALPNVCVESAPGTYHPVTVSIDPLPFMKSFRYQIGGDIFPFRFTMTTRFYLNDQLVKTQTSSVQASAVTDVTFATYP